MSRVCQVTGKRPRVGHTVSHANNKTKRRFLPNLKKHRFWIESQKRFVTLRVSTQGMRLIDKHGIETILMQIRARNTTCPCCGACGNACTCVPACGCHATTCSTETRGE